MGRWHPEFWESDVTGVPRSERRSGEYRWYEPDPLVGRARAVPGDLARRIAQVERRIRSLDGPGADVLSSVARFLLRSEAIASSHIEGVAPSAKQIALAELGTTEQVQGLSAQAKLVANNLTVVQEAAGRLAEVDTITRADLEQLHAALLADEPRLHGIRTRQNWIGGLHDGPHPRRPTVRPGTHGQDGGGTVRRQHQSSRHRAGRTGDR